MHLAKRDWPTDVMTIDDIVSTINLKWYVNAMKVVSGVGAPVEWWACVVGAGYVTAVDGHSIWHGAVVGVAALAIRADEIIVTAVVLLG